MLTCQCLPISVDLANHFWKSAPKDSVLPMQGLASLDSTRGNDRNLFLFSFSLSLLFLFLFFRRCGYYYSFCGSASSLVIGINP
ncbi:hypothetical protein I7I53_08662 [Histoplasma capsulatum var. duboisii H88]|uniref:Uncharacterized protein n=1 Tax=Ajellomyces capsulatus (strain H88) TaxID=544711 RepID=A0A8A1LM18_AJEC8|nr:hypothetical protein I7I53_08662 [Histoplasma capsulatum var. duboisii H88]